MWIRGYMLQDVLHHAAAAQLIGRGFRRFENIDNAVHRGLIENLALGGAAEVVSGEQFRHVILHVGIKQLHVAASYIEKLGETSLQATVVLNCELPFRVLVEYIIAATPKVQGNAGKIFRGNAVNADCSPISVFTHKMS